MKIVIETATVPINDRYSKKSYHLSREGKPCDLEEVALCNTIDTVLRMFNEAMAKCNNSGVIEIDGPNAYIAFAKDRGRG